MTVLERYENLKSKVIKRREDFLKFMAFIESETEYLTAPASTKFHLCKEGGLLEHSVNVAENLLKIKNALAPEIEDESCVIVALLHDLGKVGMPKNPQYIKNFPSEKQKKYGLSAWPPYKFNYNLVYLSVPVRSLYLIGDKISLTEEEVQAIIYHDGQYVDDNKSVAMHEEKLTLLLQYADFWSCSVTENNLPL
ncbi:MAG: HD domain-containing protein [Selenomonadaceae bacterium]|nr:HD domain-containing protein [Selenomonadaceae bacterium]